MSSSKAILVSQDPSLMEAVRGAIASTRGIRLEVLGDIDTACKETLGDDQVLVNLVHLDGMTNVAGLTRILQGAAGAGRPVATIVICEREHPERTLALMRLGVVECLSRPLNLGRLAYLIDSLTIGARHGVRRALDSDACEVLSLGGESPFLYVSNTRMGRMVEQIQRIAGLETTVVLGGETGTGKTHLAEVIHRLSSRRDEPFLTINVGALAANLIESEMFGHAKGAFTGADAERTGKFAAVGRGTLFLDEIDSLPPGLQAKLLRVVEERKFEPVGSNKTRKLERPADRGQQQAARAGGGRREVPGRPVLPVQRGRLRAAAVAGAHPLIPALVGPLMAEFAARAGRRIEGIAPAAMRALQEHSWPGNVRELRNAIERAVALCPGEVIELEDLPDHFYRTVPGPAPAPQPGSRAHGVRAHARGVRRPPRAGRRPLGVRNIARSGRCRHPPGPTEGRSSGGGDVAVIGQFDPGRVQEAGGGVAHRPGAGAQRLEPAPRRSRAGRQPHDPLQEAAQVRAD